MDQDPFASLPHDPRDPAFAELRAADRDRDAVLAVLVEAYADGRLTREEYDERSEALAATRTLGALPELVHDLVPTSPGVVRSSSARPVPSADLRVEAARFYQRQRREAVWGALSASIICLVIWFVLTEGFFWPAFVMLGTGMNVGRVLFQRQDIIDDRVEELEKKQRKALERQQRAEREEPGGPA